MAVGCWREGRRCPAPLSPADTPSGTPPASSAKVGSMQYICHSVWPVTLRTCLPFSHSIAYSFSHCCKRLNLELISKNLPYILENYLYDKLHIFSLWNCSRLFISECSCFLICLPPYVSITLFLCPYEMPPWKANFFSESCCRC